MRYERISECKWAEVVRGKRHVPAEPVLGGVKLVDTRIVYEAGDGKIVFCDLFGCISHTPNIR